VYSILGYLYFIPNAALAVIPAEAGIQHSSNFLGFRLALATASLAGITIKTGYLNFADTEVDRGDGNRRALRLQRETWFTLA
jgi:hypothetical protein